MAFLSGRAHGRDCLIHLDRAGICGRRTEAIPLASGRPPLRTWAGHTPSCQQGHGCWRDDVEAGEHVLAGDLEAAFVVLDSCRTSVVGGSPVPVDVSIPLAMLAGSSLAVVTASGTRTAGHYAGDLVVGLVRAGFPLGRAVAEANGCLGADPPAAGRLVLFGDAGLVPVPDGVAPRGAADADGVVVAAGPALVRHASRGLEVVDGSAVVVPRPDGSSSWVLPAGPGPCTLTPLGETRTARWPQRLGRWLTRLEEWSYLGLPFDRELLTGYRDRYAGCIARLEGELGAGTRSEVERDARSLLDDLAEFQRRWVQDEVDWVSRTFYDFTENWLTPWEIESGPDLLSCPQCGGRSAHLDTVRPRAGSAVELAYVDCVRCGEVSAGSFHPRFGLTVLSPAEALVGDPFEVAVLVTAPRDRGLEATLGAALVWEERFGCQLVSSRTVTLGPAESVTVRFAGRSGPATKPDLLSMRVIVAAEGEIVCATRGVWLRAVAGSR